MILKCDLCGDGNTIQEVFNSLAKAIAIQWEVSKNFGMDNFFSVADYKYWEMFAVGKPIIINNTKGIDAREQLVKEA